MWDPEQDSWQILRDPMPFTNGGMGSWIIAAFITFRVRGNLWDIFQTINPVFLQWIELVEIIFL